jgi:hypothetical protein
MYFLFLNIFGLLVLLSGNNKLILGYNSESNPLLEVIVINSTLLYSKDCVKSSLLKYILLLSMYFYSK